MKKQIIFIIKNITRIILEFIISIITIRDKNTIVIGLRIPITKMNKISNDYVMHNTKYLLLYSLNIKDLKIVYLCNDKKITKQLQECGYKNTFSRKSLKGLYFILRAKYWIYDNAKDTDITNSILSGGAICINLWHGAGGLKKVGFDMNEHFLKLSSRLQNIQIALTQKDSIYIVNSKYEAECRKSAYKINDKRIKILGSPRLDILYNDIPNSDLFMEKDFARIKSYKEQGKKLFFYTPTFRDTGKDISGWLKSDRLKQFLKNNNAILVCKLHFADKNSLNIDMTEEFYKMESNSDIYPVLKYSDMLITDYSSIYFDYLHLNKPIIYYIPDIEEYETQCRGFYRSYESLTAGEYVRTEEELLNTIQKVANGEDKYKEKRKSLLDEMFVYQDGNNCERVVEWIKSLN